MEFTITDMRIEDSSIAEEVAYAVAPIMDGAIELRNRYDSVATLTQDQINTIGHVTVNRGSYLNPEPHVHPYLEPQKPDYSMTRLTKDELLAAISSDIKVELLEANKLTVEAEYDASTTKFDEILDNDNLSNEKTKEYAGCYRSVWHRRSEEWRIDKMLKHNADQPYIAGIRNVLLRYCTVNSVPLPVSTGFNVEDFMAERLPQEKVATSSK